MIYIDAVDYPVISSTSNQRIISAVKLRENAGYRYETGLFTVESLKLCSDAAASGIEILQCYITEELMQRNAAESTMVVSAAEHVFLVAASVMSKLSDQKSPQGVFCVCRIPELKSLADILHSGGRYIALERVADPSNLGAIARSAEAFGIDALILTDSALGSGCDVYSPKAQRAAMGSLFRVPVFHAGRSDETIVLFKAKDIKTFAAALSGSATAISEVNLRNGGVVFIGNEGTGLDEKTVDLCDECIIIPMKGKANSLNAAVAASIMIYELVK